MLMGQQLKNIIQCTSNTYCRAQRKSSVGKSIDSEILLLKKLYLAQQYYDTAGYNCNIDCMLITNCNCN